MKNTILVLALLIFLGNAGCAVIWEPSSGSGSSDHRRLNPADRSDERPYNHAVMAGDTLYVAGTIGVDPATGGVPEGVEQEIRLCLDGIKEKLALANMSMDDLVSIQVFCPDLSLYDQFNAIYRTYFAKDFPARGFIGSGPLLCNGHFEIMGIAVQH